ncbi:MAG: site-specific DNA-methyltransferase [Desulfosporosinus sp.]|nr:site-specific DNA-methyltransferase [Desulfosporosinus sp.]
MTDTLRADVKSMDIQELQINKLKGLFPEVFAEGNQIDWERLRLTLGDAVDIGKERYGMVWPGKADCYKTIQRPSIATLKPAREESVDFDTTQNLFIEGDNLEVLKLLQKSYLGKVKLIYIDPPYNTGNDLIYPDNYSENLETYLRYTGQMDDEGRKFSTNTETDGRFHSKWMNMMYPRLFLAKNLLRDDGLVFISLDDTEIDNLKKICSEIFGEENFLAQIVWQKKTSPDARTVISAAHDYIIVFTKNIDIARSNVNSLPFGDERTQNYSNPDNDLRGSWASVDLTGQVGRAPKGQFYTIEAPNGNLFPPPEGRCWALAEKTFYDLLADKRIWFGKDGNARPRLKKFLSESDGTRPWTWWDNKSVGHNQEGNQELKKIFDDELIFDNPKPTRLIRRILDVATSPKVNDIVVDFFGGSGTTAQAVIEKNIEDNGSRRFIIIQLPEVLKEESNSFKASSNALKLGYKTIADIGKERIRRVAVKIKNEFTKENGIFDDATNFDLGFKVFKLAPSNFKVWDASMDKTPKVVQTKIEAFVDHIDPKATEEDVLYELLLKAGYTLITSIEKLTMEGKLVYSIDDNSLLICLEKELSLPLFRTMAARKPARVICLDVAFGTYDALKTNAVQIMKSQDVEFRTV